MKGAKGVLISITGGKDLTLYEVDEAATRIREEVDKDANIIVGATFDESLDGIIRVSVVATGIDKVAPAAAAKPAETGQRVRPSVSPAERQHERIEREPAARRCARSAAQTAAAIEQAATAAVAAALGQSTEIDDVTIRSMPPKPVAVSRTAARAGDACRASIRPISFRRRRNAMPQRPRMPRIEELPIPAQREI